MPLSNYHISIRALGHDKGAKIKSAAGPPTRSEGNDGDMQIYNGHLYIKDKYIWHHFIPTINIQQEANTKLIAKNQRLFSLFWGAN